MLEQLRDSIGPYGTERVAFLKEQFQNIIKNAIPFEIKCILTTFDNIPLHKFLKIKKSQRNKKYSHYICDRNEEVVN